MPKKKKSNNHISTKLAYLDLSVVLANYRNPEFWGRKWIIYKHGNVEIWWMMTHINVSQNLIVSTVGSNEFVYAKGRLRTHVYSKTSSCDSIPINNPEYKQELFERNLLAASLRVINYMEESAIRGYAEYRKAIDLDWDAQCSFRKIAEEVADKYILPSPYAETMKSAFIEKYVDDNSPDYTSQVLRNYDHKVFGGLYLMLCSWFGREEESEKHKKLVGDGKKQHIWTEMFAKAKQLQSEEWRNAMAEALAKEVKKGL